ncbi:MAG: IclR family transcriptional regulator C-terminal domain-containing protein [Candidatus Ratteibacteria bacterium]|nr:IclR family transcriptional regulator C-terminal domain-containing protein [Candidatus Ratteibacteria bacterium]
MIQVIKRAVEVLDFVAESPEEPKGLGEIAKAVQLNLGTCANIIKTLCEYNLLEQVEKKKGYILGPRVYYLARNGPYRKDIVGVIEPYLLDLAYDVKETVLVATLHQGKRFILMQVDGSRNVVINKDFFFQESIYSTATGRLLLAFMSSAELNGFIKKYGLPGRKVWSEASTKKKLIKVISDIKKKGMAIHITEYDVAGIAFPVRQGGKVIAALGLFLPSFRFRGKHKEDILKKMEETSKKMSEALTEDYPSHPVPFPQGERG